MYSFKCGDDIKDKLKGISKSQSKHNKFEGFYNCFFGEEYQKNFDNFIYLQRVKKFTLSLFDDKRCYLNEIESKLEIIFFKEHKIKRKF